MAHHVRIPQKRVCAKLPGHFKPKQLKLALMGQCPALETNQQVLAGG